MNFLGKNKTFHPKKNIVGIKSFESFTQRTLISDFRELVKLPKGEEINEWLAFKSKCLLNTASQFFDQVVMLHSTLMEFCTVEDCPIMNAGASYEYHWCDGEQFKKPTKMSAAKYSKHLFRWIDKQLKDPSIFPVAEEDEFPKHFLSIVKNIFKRLFRIYAHAYLSHGSKIKELDLDAHWNTSFQHFIFFIDEFDLISAKELVPLKPVIDEILSH